MLDAKKSNQIKPLTFGINPVVKSKCLPFHNSKPVTLHCQCSKYCRTLNVAKGSSDNGVSFDLSTSLVQPAWITWYACRLFAIYFMDLNTLV